jgi:hypothetical protein
MVNRSRILYTFAVLSFALTGASLAQNAPPPAHPVHCNKPNGCPHKQAKAEQKQAQKAAQKQAKAASKAAAPQPAPSGRVSFR